MSQQQDKREERVERVIQNFRHILDLWNHRKIKTAAFQDTVMLYLNKYSGNAQIAFDMIIRTIRGIPKAVRTPSFELLLDVSYFINIYYESMNSRYATKNMLAAARDNILMLFRDTFTSVMADQIGMEDMRDDKYDDAALNVSGDVFDLYSKGLRRETLKRADREDEVTPQLPEGSPVRQIMERGELEVVDDDDGEE